VFSTLHENNNVNLLREKSNLLVLFRNLSDKSAGVQPSSDVGCRLESEFQSFGYRLTPLIYTRAVDGGGGGAKFNPQLFFVTISDVHKQSISFVVYMRGSDHCVVWAKIARILPLPYLLRVVFQLTHCRYALNLIRHIALTLTHQFNTIDSQLVQKSNILLA